MKKWLFFILFIPVCILGGQLVYLYYHKEFKPNEFATALVHKKSVEVPLMDDAEKAEVRHILQQPFTFLGLGKQMTAYESADHQYVLKLFNPRSRIKEKWFHDVNRLKFFCSMKWFSHAYFKRNERLLKLFDRHAIAFREIKDEAGLVYVHLNPSTDLHQSVNIADKDGAQYTVLLDDVPFVLQRKVELAGARLSRLIQNNDQEGIKLAFNQIHELFSIRASKGITDRIQTLHNNYGFFGDKAVQIDVGRISVSKAVQENPSHEVDRIMESILEANACFR